MIGFLGWTKGRANGGDGKGERKDGIREKDGDRGRIGGGRWDWEGKTYIF